MLAAELALLEVHIIAGELLLGIRFPLIVITAELVLNKIAGPVSPDTFPVTDTVTPEKVPTLIAALLTANDPSKLPVTFTVTPFALAFTPKIPFAGPPVTFPVMFKVQPPLMWMAAVPLPLFGAVTLPVIDTTPVPLIMTQLVVDCFEILPTIDKVPGDTTEIVRHTLLEPL